MVPKKLKSAKKQKVDVPEIEIATAAIHDLAAIALDQDNILNPSDPPPLSTEDIFHPSGSPLTHQPQKSAAAYSPTKAKLRRKIKLLQQKLRRRDKKIVDLNSMLTVAQKMCDMSSGTTDMLKDTSMSIRKQILWDKSRNKYAGYVECAGIVEEPEPSVASEAL